MFVIKVILSVFFILASSIKILGWNEKVFKIQLEFFEKYGLNRRLMFIVGLIELFGALNLLSPEPLSSFIGSSVIFLVSLGAIGFHLKFDTIKDAIPAIITLSLSGYLVYNYII